MPIPRPKILTAITVPTGGWVFKVYISAAGSYDTPQSVTIPAGTYYLAWDAQSDDLLWKVNSMIATACAIGGDRLIDFWIGTDNKVRMQFSGSDYTGATKRQVKIAWTESAAGLATALGFDSSADDTSTATDNPTFTADYQHAYGWYADEDCSLEFLNVEDINVISAPQAVSLSGVAKTQLLGSRYRNELKLQYLSRAKTWSQGIAYGTTPVYPYARNVPLECWWQAARQGTRFRVYRDAAISASVAIAAGTETANNTTTVTDSSKAMTTDPQQYKSMALYFPDLHNHTGSQPGKFFISSHTATVFTAPNAAPNGGSWNGGSAGYTYYVFDHRYQTYQVDTKAMNEFNPDELPAIDRYNITIPLLRYVA